MKTICILGLGYIGLPTASFLATKGHQVHGVDVRQSVVDALNEGTVLIREPSLDILVKSAVGSGRLKASTVPVKADIFILALPTPFLENKKPDMSYVHEGAMCIAPYLEPGNLVILESTSPVGTTEEICQWLQEARPDLLFPPQPDDRADEQVYVAHCPERVLPGRILLELVENDRIVGGVDARSTEKAVDFYSSFVQGTVFATAARVAEFTKLAENAYRDVNIAFANELSLVCDSLGVDVWKTIEMANKHPRVNILRPGPGVGGHCISVDPWFLVDSAPEQTRLIRTAREVNDHKPDWVFSRIKKWAAKLNNPVVACMGIAFKPDVDDLRESPSLHIVEKVASMALHSSFPQVGSGYAVRSHAIVTNLARHGVNLAVWTRPGFPWLLRTTEPQNYDMQGTVDGIVYNYLPNAAPEQNYGGEHYRAMSRDMRRITTAASKALLVHAASDMENG